MDNINFVTMPVEQDLYDPNRLAPSDQADDVWNALREDKPIPEESVSLAADGTSPSQGATPTDGAGGTGNPTAVGNTPAAPAPAPADAATEQSSPGATVDPATQCH